MSWYSEVFDIIFANIDREKARTCKIIDDLGISKKSSSNDGENGNSEE